MSQRIEDLVIEMQNITRHAIDAMKKDVTLAGLGVTGIYISETKRALSTQMAYYSRGRMSVSDVKKMYAAAGLYHISDEEAKTPNTQTLASKHIEGKAIALVPEIEGCIAWNAPADVWRRMGEIGENYGLEWGGSWTGFQDRPHFQLKELA